MKILMITNTPPIPTWGGAMTLYRHFCERKDFTIRVITDDPGIEKYPVPYPYMVVSKGKLIKRLSRTRFSKLVHTYTRLVGLLLLPDKVLSYATQFKPDAVFTVAGSWSWMALLAKRVARKLGVPLIGSFMDWWLYNAIYAPWAGKMIERKFRLFYKQCELAICTSEGMQQALGKHPNSVVLYPTGATMKKEPGRLSVKESDLFTLAFAGNLGEWYGRMLEALVIASQGTGLRFAIYGSNPTWSAEFDAYAREQQIYLGQLPFEQLEQQMEQAGALVLLMGFDASCAPIESTSFKTKFLDYLTFHKPILLWGPPYCSAVAVAQEFGSAEICTSPAAEDFLEVIKKVKENHQLQQTLVNNAYRMYQERFHPDKIHAILKKSITALKHA